MLPEVEVIVFAFGIFLNFLCILVLVKPALKSTASAFLISLTLFDIGFLFSSLIVDIGVSENRYLVSLFSDVLPAVCK